ncbi:MAG TPA: hypothetical protein VHZ03_31820 [Trebonia sp.]|jgi:hypothetical protein|nr:hypothetical protein [Trebonia sp.]
MPNAQIANIPALVVPLDIDTIETRALAAPGGNYEVFPDSVWIPWSDVERDDEHDGQWWDSGRYIAWSRQDWHSGTGSSDPDEIWPFIAQARPDILALVREVRHLRGELAAAVSATATADAKAA